MSTKKKKMNSAQRRRPPPPADDDVDDPMIVDGAEPVDPSVAVAVAVAEPNSGADDVVSPLVQEEMKASSFVGMDSPAPASSSKKRRAYTLKEYERRVQSSYKKLKREAERKFGVDSLGRRKPPPPREATPVPNVYRRRDEEEEDAAAVPRPGASSSAPPAARSTTAYRPRSGYQGVSFRGALRGISGRAGAGAGATDSRSRPAPTDLDPSLGYSGVAYRRPDDGRDADPRFSVFDLEPSPVGGVHVSVRRAATEPMTYRSSDDDPLDDANVPRARGRAQAARRLNFDPQMPMRWEADGYDNDNIPNMDDEDHNVGRGSTMKKMKSKGSWDDVLDHDFDAFPPHDASFLWARLMSLGLQLLWTAGVVTAKGLLFVWWWISMAVLAEYVVTHFIAPDIYDGKGSTSLSSSSSSSPIQVLSPVIQHVAPWIPYRASSMNRSILTSHPVASSFLTESFPEFGPLPRSFLYPAPPPVSSTHQAPAIVIDSAASSWLPSWNKVWNGEWLCPFTLCTSRLASHVEEEEHEDYKAEGVLGTGDEDEEAETVHEEDEERSTIATEADPVGIDAVLADEVDDGSADSDYETQT